MPRGHSVLLSQVAGIPPRQRDPELLSALGGGPLVVLLTLLCLQGNYHPCGDYSYHFNQFANLEPGHDQQELLGLPSSQHHF